MRYGSLVYAGTVVAAVVFQYAVQHYLPYRPFWGSWSLLPWSIHIFAYAMLGAIAWYALRPHSPFLRIALLSLVGILPHLVPELAGQTDPGYPHIGLLFIVPDLVCVALGAVIAGVLGSKRSTPKSS